MHVYCLESLDISLYIESDNYACGRIKRELIAYTISSESIRIVLRTLGIVLDCQCTNPVE